MFPALAWASDESAIGFCATDGMCRGKFPETFQQSVPLLVHRKRLPLVGFESSWLSGPELQLSIRTFIQQGGRHISVGPMQNHTEVGLVIRATGVPREELFITVKVDDQYLVTSTETIRETVQTRIAELDLGYVDVMLSHATMVGQWWKKLVTYTVLREAIRNGTVRAIGFSNYQLEEIDKLINTTRIYPTLCQIECHPHSAPDVFELAQWCQAEGRVVTVYSTSEHLDSAAMVELAKVRNVTTRHIYFLWAFALNFTVIASERIVETLEQLPESQLTAIELALISKPQTRETTKFRQSNFLQRLISGESVFTVVCMVIGGCLCKFCTF